MGLCRTLISFLRPAHVDQGHAAISLSLTEALLGEQRDIPPSIALIICITRDVPGTFPILVAAIDA